MDQHPAVTSLWSPLSQPVFRALWIAGLLSNIGSLMHSVGAAWLMVTLTAGSPLMIALIQTAMSLPMFLLALPAGALADLGDRRRLLILTQGWMLAVAASLGALALMDAISPWLLVSLTFALGVGSALNGPAWLAIDNDLVSQEELPDAITLDSMGFNVSRVLGPVLGGLILARAGPAGAFLLNAVSFLGVLIVIYRWRRPPIISANERLAPAMAAGWRLARQTPALRAALLRLCLFLLGSSALWAFLPSAWYRLGGSPSGYGFILGCLGAGAVAGALALPYLRVLPLDRLLLGASLVFAAAILVLALITHQVIVGVALFGAGAAWLLTISSFNLAVQSAVPLWFRSRAGPVHAHLGRGYDRRECVVGVDLDPSRPNRDADPGRRRPGLGRVGRGSLPPKDRGAISRLTIRAFS